MLISLLDWKGTFMSDDRMQEYFLFPVPMVLKCCAEFIESHGIVDGIYRLSGVTSNIQKLR
jgi:RhoGAP domain.